THEPMGRRAAERVRERRLQLDVRDAADPVRSEEPRHQDGVDDAEGPLPAATVTVTVAGLIATTVVPGSELDRSTGWTPTSRFATFAVSATLAPARRSRSAGEPPRVTTADWIESE